MDIKAIAWKMDLKEQEDLHYVLQATVKGKRQKNRVLKEFNAANWHMTGEGYDPVHDRMIVLFKRTFKDKKSWIAFARTLSFEVEELNNRTGKRKVINARRTK